MTRYYFHLHEELCTLQDAEGFECSSLSGAVEAAKAAATDVMVGEIRAGRLDLRWYISVADSSATEVARITFREMVTLRGA